jgi:hypothetical protein
MNLYLNSSSLLCNHVQKIEYLESFNFKLNPDTILIHNILELYRLRF